jgi:SPX domain protein involved in polyphosphate accumulation
MKFGKLIREQQGGWILLDYKRLKHVLKESPHTFADELWAGISTVNAAFLEGERHLVSQLSVQTAGERDCSDFLDEVRQLYRSTVLNYIACLKIVKKHDKVRLPGVAPLRPQVQPPPAIFRVRRIC